MIRYGVLKHRKRQAGDTIVEVLIAIAVISLVLAGAYAIVRRSTLTNQDTQERSLAQQLVTSQIEYLRSYTQAGNTFSGVCFDNTGAVMGTATQCVETPNGPAAANYDISVQSEGGGTYLISAQWDSLIGGRSNVSMYYRPN